MKKTIISVITISILIMLTGCTGVHTHKWKDANYQNPSMCEECGATRGLPLTADFEQYGLKADMVLNKDYVLHTLCADEKIDTTAVVTIVSSTTIKSDDSHEAKDGYQWHIIKLSMNAGDANSNAHGFTYNYLIADYYDMEKFVVSYQYADKRNNVFTVNYNGIDYTECICNIQTVSGEWTMNGADGYYHKIITITWNILVPEGYDGIVVGVHSSAIDNEGKLLKDYYKADDFLLFRVEG